ncbi:Thioredoxin-like 3-3 [Tetrabaena socialis]|uniref:Thioredoxin-like 3-3 n=1 Tax=Tetrabaena socialis TaxID=47790 RepID=A0A2J8A3Z1_9CHLO|nr:Thioredoxin-like 3-3 [Tetrabaena socialis]|eukprot:PNH07223.1 Thioredoxin-like 3-3 [Tetrabaena socialis]
MAFGYSWPSRPLSPPATPMDADGLYKKPQPKNKPAMISTHMAGLRTDDEFYGYLQDNKASTAVVQFGASWCTKCAEFFPTWYQLSKGFPQLKYAVAQVDTLDQAVKGVKYSPTFHFYRNGKVVDRVLGKEPQRLADHLWMHSD